MELGGRAYVCVVVCGGVGSDAVHVTCVFPYATAMHACT